MFRRAAVLLLCMVFSVLCLLPAVSPAEQKTEIKTIRVGWYETPFNRKDSFGRRTGYAYEYQRKIAAYTGWRYQYVEGTWPELMQMLKDGRIDLMSDVSYTEERAQDMLFSSIPMGSELYYVYIHPDNEEISIEDESTLNGKKVGVTASSIQKDLFLEWTAFRGITADLVMLECSEKDSIAMMARGEIDAFVTLDTYGDPELAVPLWKIGASDFYFAVSKDRPDLLEELNKALNRIQDENKFYSEELAVKYLRDSGTNLYLTAEESEWLSRHGPIRVGYQDNYLAFCAADPSTGELTGALKDYLEVSSGILANATPEFEAIAFPTASAAMEALKSGEIDCVFPANLTDYDSETEGVLMSPPLMRTEMLAVVRAEDRHDFLRNFQTRVGVNIGNTNYEMFLVEHFPSWTPVRFADTPACLDAVAAKKADCIIISNYRYNDISHQCEKLNLTTLYTGVDMDYCFAVKEGNIILYSILSKIVTQVPDATVNASLAYYSATPKSTGFMDTIIDQPVVAGLIAFCIVLVVIVVILLRRLALQKRPGS